MTALPEPTDQLSDPRELLEAYLDFYRSTLLRKLDGLPDEALRSSVLPSGWTPLELLKHLTYVEHRWLEWGFEAQDVDEPWGDQDPRTGAWNVRPDEDLALLRQRFLEQAERSRAIVARADLLDSARVGGRFETPAQAPRLSWILFHVLQEYARHVGHVDVVRELLDGETGE